MSSRPTPKGLTTALPDGEYQYSIRLIREMTLVVKDGVAVEAVTDDEHSPHFFSTGASNDAESEELTRVVETAWFEGVGQG
jgi:hypothetical protein